jgi:hypothetical protein
VERIEISKKKINFFEKNIIPSKIIHTPQIIAQGTGTNMEKIKISKKKNQFFLKRISSPNHPNAPQTEPWK